ncbi:MAG: nickel pincer cofactor biosynthesis protein LarB [Halobacteria archaeon]
MDGNELREVLEEFKSGEVEMEEAVRAIEGFSRVGDFAKLDGVREHRTGIPEAVLGEGKSPEQLRKIAADFLDTEGRVIVTRIGEDVRKELEELSTRSEWYDEAGTLVLHTESYESPSGEGELAVVTAGTSDVAVAQESVAVAREMGCEVDTFYDVGVAGVHRLLGVADQLDGYDCVVVAAGREGALPTVVAGLVHAPVIGLPVSVGYGYGGGGEAALMGMLQSCSVISVVNVDAGFVAGAQAAQIARD